MGELPDGQARRGGTARGRIRTGRGAGRRRTAADGGARRVRGRRRRQAGHPGGRHHGFGRLTVRSTLGRRERKAPARRPHLSAPGLEEVRGTRGRQRSGLVLAVYEGHGSAGLCEAGRRHDRDRADPQGGPGQGPAARLDAVQLRRAGRFGGLHPAARRRFVRVAQHPLRPGGFRSARGGRERRGAVPHGRGAGELLPEGRHDAGHGGGGGGVHEGRRRFRQPAARTARARSCRSSARRTPPGTWI